MQRHPLASVAAALLLAACHAPPPPPAPPPEGSPPVSSAAGQGGREEEGTLAGNRAARAEELLEGRFPGVRVTRVGDGFAVRIRGTSSVLGDNEPLYVVDGSPVEPGPGGALTGINPADIVRIEVLKDIGSTSFYGVRGANGVILITTRH